LAAIGAVLASAGVAAGAFGAHALRAQVPPHDLETWRTASQYLLVHAVAVFAISLSGVERLRVPAYLLVYGAVVFSGSLFFLVLSGYRWLGAIAPIGGSAMIIGWLWAAVVTARGTMRS
jgi:uncharacterized membrane protein YgdD (TMEM256/DUF423 family)